MELADQAIFQLQTFAIPKFSFEEPEPIYTVIDINFDPKGTYNTSNGEFRITLLFKAFASSEKASKKEYKEVINAELHAFFILPKKPLFEEIPDFFYSNSIAIIFPYIRAFVSNITLQSGLRLLILPILNLNSLSEVLKEQTSVFK